MNLIINFGLTIALVVLSVFGDINLTNKVIYLGGIEKMKLAQLLMRAFGKEWGLVRSFFVAIMCSFAVYFEAAWWGLALALAFYVVVVAWNFVQWRRMEKIREEAGNA